MMNIARIYIDESCHLENDKLPVMCVGGLFVEEKSWKELSDKMKQIKLEHHSPTELKWNKVSASRMTLYKSLIDFFFQQKDLRFSALLIKHKENIDNERYNNGDHNIFYYKAMFYLVRDFLNTHLYKVYMDIKDNRGKARLDMLSKVLCRVCGAGKYVHFQNIRSDESQFIQLADFFIGAIVYKQRQDIVKTNAVKNEIIEYIEHKSGYSITENTPPWEKKIKIWDFQLAK
ncbi:DUF3800 domain-containing protein [uncultured Bacteroides sp.]|uniref:DUF3800 domain-containing protein n=1 Tax=uncultured Bacteroides sp. TaxID=162156 RepID=UPI0025EAD0E7|nr:DUF3800 domain-containing protein [uncultured Bacteroides sp.]